MAQMTSLSVLCWGLLITASSLAFVGRVEGQICDIPPAERIVRMLTLHDASPDMTSFHNEFKGPCFAAVNDFFGSHFYLGASFALMHFTDKASVTLNPVDTCSALDRPFDTWTISPAYDAMPTNVGNGVAKRSQFDALYAASQLDWDSPVSSGKKLIFMYTSSLPQTQSCLPAFNPASPCEEVSYPDVDTVVAALNAKSINLILFTKPHYFDAYRNMFSALGDRLQVSPLESICELMHQVIVLSINNIYCGDGNDYESEPEPTEPPLPSFDLSCQAPSRLARVMHIQDMSADMTPYVTLMKDGIIEAFDERLRGTFTSGAVSGLIYFTNKKALLGPLNNCAAVHREFCPLPILPHYGLLPTIGASSVTRSHLDALWMAADKIDWDNPLNGGRRIVVLYSNALPSLPPTSGLPNFDPTSTCEDVDYPDVPTVITGLLSKDIYVLFVVAPEHVNDYKTMFAGMGDKLAVVFLSLDPTELQANIMAGMDELYCGIDAPTPTPGVDGTAVTLPPGDCTSNAVLQLLHLQDMSWSYTNDLANMRAKFPQLLSDLKTQFFKREMALGTFVDKPIEPVGYKGDYCYREDAVFTEDAGVFIAALDAAKIKSGRDWKESQYDAIKDGITSATLGWEASDQVDGRMVLRIVLMATDAGPHVQGDAASLPTSHPDGCNFADYPTPAELNALFTTYGIYPIIVVTSDIHNYWSGKMAALSNVGKVLHLSQPAADIFADIEAALQDLCSARRRLLSGDVKQCVEAKGGGPAVCVGVA